jgi:hypothetical protein
MANKPKQTTSGLKNMLQTDRQTNEFNYGLTDPRHQSRKYSSMNINLWNLLIKIISNDS